MTIEEVTKHIESDLIEKLNGCGIMFRMFCRVKSTDSIHHKINEPDSKYLKGQAKMRDMIGLRIVVYFPDDVEVIDNLLETDKVVKFAVDKYDTTTFHPQRLNLTRKIPDYLVDDFKAALPKQYAPYIDETYEIQIRTIFSEGWHEIEHDLRYKCQDDWKDSSAESRILNGVIATLETAEWTMQQLFNSMAAKEIMLGNYSAAIRNKMRIRIKGDGLSSDICQFLADNKHVANGIIDVDREVFLNSLLTHSVHLPLTYDNVLFLINRLEMRNKDLQDLESSDTQKMFADFFASIIIDI